MDQASSAFSTGVPVSAAIPQLAGNSRQGFGLVDGTMRRASGWVISSNTLGLSTSLYDGDAGSRSTGKERDTESGNDYFEARYYSSAMGRFMSPDWSAKEEPVPYAKLGDPQTLNLYSYVENGPLNRVDADGHADQVVPNSAMTPLAECYDQGSSSGCPGGQAAGQVSSGIDHDTSDANNRAHADQAAANAGNGAAQPAQAQQQ
ncbi:MAG: RHS repeat-associated core domain-containing protein, partial [Terracidiphilus sp.]